MVDIIRKGAVETVEPILKDISRLLLRVRICVDVHLDLATAVRAQVLESIGNDDYVKAFSPLRLLKLSPLDTNIPDDYFADLVTTLRTKAVQALDTDDICWIEVGVTLSLMRELPLNTKIYEDSLLDVAAAIQVRAVRHIRNAEYTQAKSAIGLIEHLPSHMRFPNGSFLGVATAIRAQTMRYLEKEDTPRAEWALECLPANIKIPDDGLLDVVTAIKKRAVKYMNMGYSSGVAVRLHLLRYLPLNTIPKDFFIDFARKIRTQAVQNLEDMDVSTARSTGCKICIAGELLRLIYFLPSNTSLTDDYFLDVVQAIRARAIRHIAKSEPHEAKCTLELIQHLTPKTSIPKNYFLEAVTRSTISLIRQAPYNTRVSEDLLSLCICCHEVECKVETAEEAAFLRDRPCCKNGKIFDAFRLEAQA